MTFCSVPSNFLLLWTVLHVWGCSLASMDNWTCIVGAVEQVSVTSPSAFSAGLTLGILLLQKHAVYVTFIFSSGCLFVDVEMLQ